MKKLLTILLLIPFALHAQIQDSATSTMTSTWQFCAVFDAGIDTTIAYDATCQMNGSITGDYDSINYSSLTLTGTFDDLTDTNAVFTPSAPDIATGGGYIRMTAYYYQLTGVDSMLLTITPEEVGELDNNILPAILPFIIEY